MATKSRRRRAALRVPLAPSEVRPNEPVSDLRGRQPVRITVEDHNLVAYGFRDQRVEIPRGSVSAVLLNGDRSLILLDRDRRMLLKAPGDWHSYPLAALCKRAGLPRPRRVTEPDGGLSDGRSTPQWRRAPGYRRLRARPPLFVPGMIALGCAAVALTGAGIGAGADRLGPGVGVFALVHGGDARLGNLVSGAVATVALPVLIWRLARRVSRQRRADREELIEGIW